MPMLSCGWCACPEIWTARFCGQVAKRLKGSQLPGRDLAKLTAAEGAREGRLQTPRSCQSSGDPCRSFSYCVDCGGALLRVHSACASAERENFAAALRHA